MHGTIVIYKMNIIYIHMELLLIKRTSMEQQLCTLGTMIIQIWNYKHMIPSTSPLG